MKFMLGAMLLCLIGAAKGEDLPHPRQVAIHGTCKGYAWLPDGRLLVNRNDVGVGHADSVSTVNVATGAEDKFLCPDGVPKSWGIPIRAPYYPSLFPSPDGKWILATKGLQWVAFNITTRKEVSWKPAIDNIGRAMWMPDSSGWIEYAQSYDNDYHLSITVHRLGVGPRLGAMLDGKRYTLPHSAMVVGFLSDNKILVGSDVLGSMVRSELRLCEYQLGDRATEIAASTVVFPYSIIADVALSPDKKRLCWLVVSQRSKSEETAPRTGIQARGQRYGDRPSGAGLAPLHHPVSDVLSLWVTSLTGRDYHHVCQESLPGLSAVSLLTNSVTWLTGLMWSPSGHAIAYQHAHELWIVRVDTQ